LGCGSVFGGGEISRTAADSKDLAEAMVAYFLEKLAAYARLAFQDHPSVERT
jgi:hypothetical protein